jgi:hypothetical protein
VKMANIRHLGMNQTDQTSLKIPEPMLRTWFDQTTPIAGTTSSGDHLNSCNFQIPVLARIPDLNAPVPQQASKESSKPSVSTCLSSRLLSAGLSFRILMGLGSFLVVIAIAPNLIIKITNGIQTNSEASQKAWEPQPPAPTADLAPAWKPQNPQTESTSSSLPSPTASSPLGPPNLLTPNNAASIGKNDSTNNTIVASSISKDSGQISPWPRDVDNQADSSPWPNPAQSTLTDANSRTNLETSTGAEASANAADAWPVVTNRPMALGEATASRINNPTDYRSAERYTYPSTAAPYSRQNESSTADRRNTSTTGGIIPTPRASTGNVSGTVQSTSGNEPSAARLEGVIDTNSNRNIYDYPRPSIHQGL